MRDDERCGRSKEVNTPELIGQRVRVRVTMLRFLSEFKKRVGRKRSAFFKWAQWHFHQDNAPVHNSILVTDYLTKMGFNSVRHRPYSPDLSPCDFWLFPKLRGCRYKTIEEMKEAVTKVIDTRTQEDFHGALQKLFGTVQVHCSREEITSKGTRVFMCVLSIKVPGNLFNDPRVYIYIYYSRDLCPSTTSPKLIMNLIRKNWSHKPP